MAGYTGKGYFSRPRLPRAMSDDPRSALMLCTAIGAAILIFTEILLPFNHQLSCGLDIEARESQYMADETAYRADLDAYRVAYTAWLGPDGLPDTGDDVGDRPIEPTAPAKPDCISPLPRMLANLLPMWPLLSLAALIGLVLKRTASPHVAIVMALLLVVSGALRAVEAGDPTGESVAETAFMPIIVVIRLVLCSIPRFKEGAVPSLLGLASLALWPSVVMDVNTVMTAANPPGGLSLVVDLLLWGAIPAVVVIGPWISRHQPGRIVP